ncbi:MAG: hypothetical protein MK161_14855 [Pirellulales bacterium]|nr:hypothetical protein [Pirellulales bacterium]
MRFNFPRLLIYLAFTNVTSSVFSDEPLLRPNDRVAILGGTFVERMQASGDFEAELQYRRPDWNLSFRNIGWSGDDVHGIGRKRFDSPADGFKRILKDVETSDANVVLLAYGFSEASDGQPAVARFGAGLARLADELRKQQKHVILLTPVAMPGYKVTGYDQWLSECRSIVERVGKDRDIPVVSVQWVPSKGQVTHDRLLPNGEGYSAYAASVAGALVGQVDSEPPSESKKTKLKQLISRKNQLFFHRYRPQNETYLYLFRKHEQGNNAVEIPQFDPLIKQADQAIWQSSGS